MDASDGPCGVLLTLCRMYDTFVLSTATNLELLRMQLNATVELLKELNPDIDIDGLAARKFYRIRAQKIMDLQATSTFIGNLQAVHDVDRMVQDIRNQAKEAGCQDVVEDVFENYQPKVDQSIVDATRNIPENFAVI